MGRVNYPLSRRSYVKTIGAVSALGTTTLAGCTGGNEDEILIGNVAGLSGPMASYGPHIQSGLEFAAQEINENGGPLGRDLRIKTEDSESAPETAATKTLSLMDEGAVAITGPVLSDVAIRMRQETESKKVPLLPIQGASTDLLTKDTRYTFRVGALPAPYYSRGTGEFADSLGVENYGAIVADYSFGNSYREGLEKYVQPRDFEQTIKMAPVGASDFKSQLRAIPDDIDYMDLGGHPVGIYTIIPQMWDVGLDPEATSGPGDPLPNFYDTLGDNVDKGIVQMHMTDPTSDEYVELANRFYEETNEFFDPYKAFGYVIANLVAEAAEDAGEADSQAIRDSISDMRYESVLAYPLEYTEWGELKESKLVALEFNLDAPEYYPEGDFNVEAVYETETYDPLDPEEWQ